ncbi:uncharacterized protein EDB91DRAFT_1252511 [Suillus paluster]|uniref:uncharacterized protein n=1 Tax=Suillus paluster TaxID=48578 RepID=UPI001B86CAAD|nr:uncharacterized protein EDB91DRAFT_1252511 [Suillus paluster]KAG1730651.1 hypothetical protein EDB91DRAFT_1252511 [Suillus paluster]
MSTSANKGAIIQHITTGKANNALQATHYTNSTITTTVSSQTVRNVLKAAHLKAAEKTTFGLAHQNWTVEDWKHVICSDETKINRIGSDGKDLIATDPQTHGSTFVPVFLGSDKTMVSVATGNNEYYPLYASIGNVHNNVRCAHHEALAIVGFLAIPKTTKEHASDLKFRKFHRQLFQSSLTRILERLWPGMTKPEVVRFGDGHFRRVIYGLGPYIADYEEQVLCLGPCTNLDKPASERCCEHTEALVEEATLGDLWDEYGIPFTNNFPRTDIHELIAPDLLHQLIKGTFKDHIVDWVKKYLDQTHGKTAAKCIMDDIDRRIVATPSFAGL